MVISCVKQKSSDIKNSRCHVSEVSTAIPTCGPAWRKRALGNHWCRWLVLWGCICKKSKQKVSKKLNYQLEAYGSQIVINYRCFRFSCFFAQSFNTRFHSSTRTPTALVFNVNHEGKLPRHVTYKIRQNTSMTQPTTQIRLPYWRPDPQNWNFFYYQVGKPDYLTDPKIGFAE